MRKNMGMPSFKGIADRAAGHFVRSDECVDATQGRSISELARAWMRLPAHVSCPLGCANLYEISLPKDSMRKSLYSDARTRHRALQGVRCDRPSLSRTRRVARSKLPYVNLDAQHIWVWSGVTPLKGGSRSRMNSPLPVFLSRHRINGRFFGL